MLFHNFSDRAQECLRLAERAHSDNDRQFFLELARAWYGLKDEESKRRAAPTAH